VVQKFLTLDKGWRRNKMRRGSVVIILGGLILSSVFVQTYGNFGKADAQDPVMVWPEPAIYDGGSGDDRAVDLVVDAPGNVYVTGSSRGPCGTSGSGADYVTIKYLSASGSEDWAKRYNQYGTGPCNDTPNAITEDVSGVYVTGNMQAASNYYYATVKYELDGTDDETTRYNYFAPRNPPCSRSIGFLCPATYLKVGSPSFANDIAVVPGGIVVTGKSVQGSDGEDYVTIKYDAIDGDSIWASVYDGPASGSSSDDEATAITVDNAGNIIVTGYSKDTDNGDDYATVKYNSSGEEAWDIIGEAANRYNGPADGNDWANDIAVDASGDIFVTGKSTGDGDDYATLKILSSDGGFGWNFSGEYAARYNGGIGGSKDEPVAITLDSSGDVYVTGTSDGTGKDIVTIKYNSSDGGQVWLHRFNNGGNDFGYDIAVDGRFVYVVGSSQRTTADFVILIYNKDSGGSGPDYTVYYDRDCGGTSCGGDIAKAIALISGYFYVTGESDGVLSGADYDYLTLKYSKPGTGVMEEEERLFPTSVFFVYPNPFYNITSIHGKGEFKVYDITGRLRSNVTEGIIGENLKSGVYFIEQGDIVVKITKIH
jgi:hypothetical protein